ncbi:HEXXH motif domain-containing protein [Phytohabitans houttuyneae]|uniref:HEXXH motif domain-containing protein n=1 Tax=Phytohabitans houttuyneae TaxID=1076126 RepID=A0A6V8K1R6_9ACTN|nr:HEXXH motif domain-containing protein [Phytohabitans houttuyneae]GFJ77634.1 HEXXH motif domain-containing protein [Phytohabitans houttuyneae]
MNAPAGLPAYRLTGAEFDSLGSGYGDAPALATLRSAQLSKRMLLLAALRQAIGTDTAAWRALRDVTASRPDIAREVLGHPFVDSWATRCLRRSTGAPAAAYLAGLAVAAAARAGTDLDLDVSECTGDFFVPTVGLAYGLGTGPVAVRVRADSLSFTGTASSVTVPAPYAVDAPGWCASRRFTVHSAAGPLTVTLEDLDPYRSCFGHAVAPRLDRAAAGTLESLVDGAWRLIASDHPQHAVAIGECLRSLVPLVAPLSGSTSASAQTAFGAVAVSTPDAAAGLALLMIHETQHMKLGGLLDLVRLCESTRDGVYHAPWRADPRPVRALLQGVYAHAGVADFWRVRRTRVAGGEARTADFEFAYWLAQTRLAAAALAGSDELTPEGERFVGQLVATLDGWWADPIDADIRAGVEELMVAVATRWRLDNHRPEPDVVAGLTAAWAAGRRCPPIERPAAAPAEAGGPARVEGLAAQVRARLTGTAAPAATPAEAAYLSGRVPESLSAFRSAAMSVPDDPPGWVGLALAVRAGGTADAARALAERPDLVRAAYVRLRAGGRAPAPDELAAWLATGLS